MTHLQQRPQSDPGELWSWNGPSELSQMEARDQSLNPIFGRGSSLELKAIPGEGLSNKLSAAITHGCWDGTLPSEGGLGSRPRLFDASQPFREEFCLEQKISPRISECPLTPRHQQHRSPQCQQLPQPSIQAHVIQLCPHQLGILTPNQGCDPLPHLLLTSFLLPNKIHASPLGDPAGEIPQQRSG